MKQYLIRCGTFFDGVRQRFEKNVDIVVEGPVIRSVGKDQPLHEDMELIDLSGQTVLPGCGPGQGSPAGGMPRDGSGAG